LSGGWTHLDGHDRAWKPGAGGRRPAVRGAETVPGFSFLGHVVAPAGVAVHFVRDDSERRIRVEAKAFAKNVTGVEMEAKTARAASLPTRRDEVKGADEGGEIGPLRLLDKTGGTSGRHER